MGKSLLKDIIREIIRTKKRFLSLFFIVLMGVGVFGGIKAASRDMKLTADKYADDYNLMDIQIISTMGLTQSDADSISKIKGVENVEPTYSIDAVVNKGNKGFAIKVNGIDFEKVRYSNVYINKPKLIKGRFPENDSECVVELKFLKDLGYSIGDTVTLNLGSQNQKNLKNNKFKIVGIVESPYYISRDRGPSTVGNGQIQAFMMVPKTAFSMSSYTEIYVLVNNAKRLFSYSDEYYNFIKPVKDDLVKLGKKRSEIRYNDIKNQAQKEIEDAKKALAAKESKYKKELSEAQDKLNQARIQLNNFKQEIYEKQIKYNEQINNGEKRIEEWKKQIKEMQDKLAQNEADLNAAEAKLDNEEKQLNYDANVKKLNDQYDTLKNSLDQLNAAINNDPTLTAQLKPKIDQLNTQIENILKQKAVLDANKQALQTNRKQLEEEKVKLANAKEKLEISKRELVAQENALNKMKIEGQKELEKARKQIADAEKQLSIEEKKYQDSKNEFDREISQAKNKIASAEKKLNEMKKPIWYVLDRKSNIGFVEFGDEADRIKALGNVFPTIFFLVAALVSLTTMTRMVEEQRTQMGILKALGYSKFAIMLKFIIYSAVATILGGIIGLFLGFNILPRIIFEAYSMMYTLPSIITEFNIYYAVLGITMALISTTIVTILVCLSDLKETPAALMRLKAPVAGKRVLLERINFIWSRLNFIQKVTARNLFRYKKRFFMTVFGIGGCTALLLTGFGIRDSISTIATKQFNEIFKYQMVTTFKSDASPNDITELMTIINRDRRIKESMLLSQSNIDVTYNRAKKSAFLVVTADKEKFKDFVVLRNRSNGTPISLTDNGVVITEKLSNMLGVKAGEYIYLKNGDGKEAKVKVTGITENYIHHYVYMSSALYKKLFNKKPDLNEIVSKTIGSSKSLEDDLSQKILKSPAVMTVNFTSSVNKIFQDVINNLLSVVLVLIVSAGSLAFVVLYNLSNINITERIRELATMKVLGLYDHEVSMYVIRENAILTIIGILLGLIMGVFLHRYVMTTAEVEILMFGRNIKPISFLYSALITIGFSALVSIVVHFQLKRVDMVQSLKSPEID
ncbi:putative ABC transport system permease protein [Caldanaerobius fijiensis DSM 17918]|uniref:Putative ABC transport system permease protein n=1 Tax=Caldanaerobius fijiensis DSM 17918 TaxID=1121256 RepID=A0A1M5D3A1_9THEO|nr:ABC transporter permease [Caldanaerobius fijiensis]SHF61365.1 putative ABC transport system permease protein [Caldanaerobius fijiensis DSM 17918]